MANDVTVIKPQAPRVPMAAQPWDYRANLVGEIATWQPPLTSADNDIRPGFELNKARARDLALSNPYAANSVEILRDAVVGKKFMLALAPDYEDLGVSIEAADEWVGIVEREWERYAEGITFDADASRKNSFTFLMHQAMAGLHMEGEALGTIEAKRGQHGYMTCLNLIEPERLDNFHQVQSPFAANGNQVRYGVERDKQGEPIAYHIREAHEHEAYWQGGRRSMQVQRVLRYNGAGRPQVLHVHDQARPNMTRGVSTAMLSTLKSMKMLGTFSDAELSRQIQSASWAAVVETELNYDQAMQLLARGGSLAGDGTSGNTLTDYAVDHLRNVAPYYSAAGMMYNGSRIVHMVPGEKLKIVQSNLQGAQFDMFTKAVLRELAAGLNVSFETLTRDYSNLSYAAARVSMEEIWRRYLRIRQLLTQQLGLPFFSAWLEEAIKIKRVPMLGRFKPDAAGWQRAKHMLCRGEFISWGRPIIDPVKERTGQGLALAMGLTTLRDEAAGDGADWQANLKQRKREAQLREELDLNPTGVDPTLVVGGNAKAGNPQEGRKARKDGEG